MNRPLVAVTGASGCIGSAVVAELARHPVELRLGLRRPGPAGADAVRVGRGGGPSAGSAATVRAVRVDLCEPQSLDALCADATVVLHLASYVGPVQGRAEAVNQQGSAALAERIRASAAPGCRVLSLSTCAVYGTGPHRGIDVDEVAPAPVSATSRTRLAGEAAMRAVGATVLRTGLVTGTGDRWVVPVLRELVDRVPGYWDGGRGLLSMIDVGDLARLVTALALTARPPVPDSVLHAAHPQPVRNRDLLRTLAGLGLLPALPDGDSRSWEWCVERLAATSGTATPRQLALLGQDHWYRSDSAWQLAGARPGPGPLARLPDSAAWYHRHLRTASPARH